MQRNLPRHSSPHDSNPLGPLEATLSCLWVLTPLTATVSLLVVIIAMFTNQWLHTEEKMNNPSYNGTGERDYLSKFTISGLWMLCFTNPGENLYDCTRIDYFSKEEYSPDPNDSTMAIPYTVTRSVVFFVAASLLLFGGYCCCLLGQCIRQRSLYTFISGVIFVLTGLVMLFGLIMYISVFKAEIGSKLRPRSHLQPPAFVYWYGYSFLLYVTGLIACQLTGITSIFLFIYKVQYEWQRKHLDDLKRGKIRNYVHLDSTVFYPCRRHPNAYVNSNSAIHFATPSEAAKRFYFSKESLQDCNMHRARSQASLKDNGTLYDFPPPPTISYQFDEHFNKQHDLWHCRPASLPRDATTNTVSTTADVNCGDDFLLNGTFDDYSPSATGQEFVTFDLDQALPTLRANHKTFDSDTLRRTTPV